MARTGPSSAPPPPVAEPDGSAGGDLTAQLTRRRLIFFGLFVIAAVAGLYFLIPKLAGLKQTWGRLRHGDPVWLAVAMLVELVSIAGYALLFGTVFGRGLRRIDWKASIEIPLAGIAAIRLLAAAGAGGVAVSAWALRRAGMGPRVIACRMVASYVLQYTVYLLALLIAGLGLRYGLFSGQAPFLLTILPAAFSAIGIVIVLSMALVPGDFERRLAQLARRHGRVGRLAARFATAPATLGAGVRTAMEVLRERRPGALGAVAYWGFDIAALGFSFKAFGTDLPVAVLVMCYFLGTLGSLLPLPGGIGGVEGGMIGAFVAFSVPDGSAVIGVLAYRAISFWLPTLPGIAGYVALRRRVHAWQQEDAAVAPTTPAAARTGDG